MRKIQLKMVRPCEVEVTRTIPLPVREKAGPAGGTLNGQRSHPVPTMRDLDESHCSCYESAGR
jgi:hypothetical protein